MNVKMLPLVACLFLSFPALATLRQSSRSLRGKLTRADWAAIQAEHERHLYAMIPDATGFHARSDKQQWLAHFDGRGFSLEPDRDTWEWGLQLSGAARAASIHVDSNRLSYRWDARLEEWFVNAPSGLKHGFTLNAPRTLKFALRGRLRPRGKGTGLDFVDSSGLTRVTYTGLAAWDATGRPLHTEMAMEGSELALRVDDRGARYPITIDPIAQSAYLKPSNTQALDHFGSSVAVSGDTVVVGASLEDSGSNGINSTPNESAQNSGAVYVFVRRNGAWTQQAYLKASNPGSGDGFGAAVAVSGNTIAVGAPGEDSGTTGVNSVPNEASGDSGAAYIFVRNMDTWSQQSYLKASNTGFGDGFGQAVAISEDTLVVGAYGESSSITGVNGAPNEGAPAAGAAYVFTRTASLWTQQAFLKASNTGLGDGFGISVAVANDIVVVGAPAEDSSSSGVNSTQNNSASDSGAAYVFVRNAGAWSQQAYLKASNPGAGDAFGVSVAVSGETVAVGAFEDSSTGGVNGTPNEAANASGAVYVFVRTAGTWSQQAFVKPAFPGQDDSFGYSVSMAGDVLAIGAIGEDSGTAGVNSVPNEGSGDSGAAYIFVRRGAVWTQHAYIKASNPGLGDELGLSVGVSAGTIVTGAMREGSATTGVNTTPNDLALEAGAAYAHTRFSRAGIFRSGFFWLEDVNGDRQFAAPPDQAFSFGGVPGDVPISGDWNGSGTAKAGVYRSANGLFVLDYDGDLQFTSTDRAYNLGVGLQPGDVPVVGDWNGDGKTKVGLFRQGYFWILDTNGDGVFQAGPDHTYAFGGVTGDIPVVGDWNGDGRSKLGLFRSGFFWILDSNGNGVVDAVNSPGGDEAFAYGGIAGDVPVVGDWNGDGRTKPGVFRSGFFWVLDQNGDRQFTGTGPGEDLAFAFGGINGDKPIIW